MARRTTFCPVSENLSVIEPRSITVFHSNLDTSSTHGSPGRLYRISTPALILIDRVDSNARPGAFSSTAPENFERLISESLSYRSAIFMSRRLKCHVICHLSLVTGHSSWAVGHLFRPSLISTGQ